MTNTKHVRFSAEITCQSYEPEPMNHNSRAPEYRDPEALHEERYFFGKLWQAQGYHKLLDAACLHTNGDKKEHLQECLDALCLLPASWCLRGLEAFGNESYGWSQLQRRRAHRQAVLDLTNTTSRSSRRHSPQELAYLIALRSVQYSQASQELAHHWGQADARAARESDTAALAHRAVNPQSLIALQQQARSSLSGGVSIEAVSNSTTTTAAPPTSASSRPTTDANPATAYKYMDAFFRGSQYNHKEAVAGGSIAVQ